MTALLSLVSTQEVIHQIGMYSNQPTLKEIVQALKDAALIVEQGK